ncbi:MAG: twin-arginine translocation signal domain-containing protein [Longimicrobiales bacterium]
MPDSDRRDFLKKLAVSTAYVAPVIKTLAAPDPAAGQVLSQKMGMMGGGMGMMGFGIVMTQAPALPTAPWANPSNPSNPSNE